MVNCSNGRRCSAIATARRARRSIARLLPDETSCSISTGRVPSNCARRCGGDLVSVFVLPPSVPELERRLRRRAEDSEQIIGKRMAKATDELSHWAEYDYVIVNHDLDQAFSEVRTVLAAERLKRERQTGLSAFVRGLQSKL